MAKFLRKPKKNMAMRLAGVLFCLTLVSFYMVSGLFARYITSGQGSDSARVITFGNISLRETGDFYDKDKTKMWLVPGKDIEKDAEVIFTGSESATYVFVEVQVSEHWTYADGVFTIVLSPDREVIRWEIDGNWEKLTDTVFYRHLAPNEKLFIEDDENEIHGVDIIKDGIITVSENLLRGDVEELLNNENPIEITFSASVVQSIGFDSAAAAWASLYGKGDAT